MKGPGYYYYDPNDKLQGPFTAEQLASWRDLLPDDLTMYALNSHSEWEQGVCFRLLHILLLEEVRCLTLPLFCPSANVWKDVPSDSVTARACLF
jgi:hypothetical protein